MSDTAVITTRPVLNERRWVWRITQEARGQSHSADFAHRKDAMSELRTLIQAALRASLVVDVTVTDQTENGEFARYHPDGTMTSKAVTRTNVLGPRCSTLPRTPAAQVERRTALRTGVGALSQPAKAEKPARKERAVAPRKRPAPPSSIKASPAKTSSKAPASKAPSAARTEAAAQAAKIEARNEGTNMLSTFMRQLPSSLRSQEARVAEYVATLTPANRTRLLNQAKKGANNGLAQMIAAAVEQFQPKTVKTPKAEKPPRAAKPAKATKAEKPAKAAKQPKAEKPAKQPRTAPAKTRRNAGPMPPPPFSGGSMRRSAPRVASAPSSIAARSSSRANATSYDSADTQPRSRAPVATPSLPGPVPSTRSASARPVSAPSSPGASDSRIVRELQANMAGGLRDMLSDLLKE